MARTHHLYEAEHFVGMRIDNGRLEFTSVIGYGAEGTVMLAQKVMDDDLYPEPYYVSLVIAPVC